jgi:hypothetical protein
MEAFKQFNEIVEADVRQKYFGRTLQDFHRRAEQIALHDGVPEGIRNHFQTARHLLIYSWFYYPFHVSRFASFFACGSLDDAVQFRRSKGDMAAPIYRVSGQVAFRPDMKMLLLGPTAAGAVLFGRKYWRGEATASPFWEYLLSPSMMIHERVA